jgi:glutathione peroxidase
MLAPLLLLTLNAMAVPPIDPPRDKTLFDFTMKDIDGKEVPLSKFKGKTILVVNVASKCGLTPQYKGLQQLYSENKDKGLVILGFPANEFNGQEPGTSAEIKSFCTANYGVTFPMFQKIVVKGEGIHPLYQWLTTAIEPKGDIEWNFAKFLIGPDGKIIKRFKPQVTPEDADLVKSVHSALR